MKTKVHSNENIDLLIKAGIGIALFIFGKKFFVNLKKETTESRVESDPSVGQAQGLRLAMNPSGNEWMRKFDGTTTDTIFSIAKEITDIESVRQAYKKLYNTSLYEDLQSELSANDYQKFLALATKGKAGSHNYAPTRSDIAANHYVITTAQANIRRTPVKQSKYFSTNNIVKLTDKGKIVGLSTGKFVYDEDHDVVFIEFWTLTTKNIKTSYFVAKSQVELLDRKAKLEREKQVKLPIEILEGIHNEEPAKQEVISTSQAQIYAENFEPLGKAPKGIIIGFPLLTLNTNQGNYIKVKTIQGLIRWIKAEQAVIKERKT
jgi:Annexin